VTWSSSGTDTAASEVVGYVLVTGITVLAIGLVVLTSGPTLDRLRSEQQYDSALRYFHDLDQGMEQLLSGSPAGSTPTWRIALGGGSLALDNGTQHKWAYAVDENANRDTWLGAYEDDDNQVDVEIQGSWSDGSDTLDVEATRWDADEDEALETSVSGSNPYTITLEEDDGGSSTDAPVAGTTIQLVLSEADEADPFAEAWITDAGTIEWTHSGSDQLRLLYQNTAIVGDRDDGQVLQNTPRLRPHDTLDDGTESLFVRLVSMEGALAVGGQTTATVLLQSEGTHSRHDASDVERVSVYPATSGETAWNRYLTADHRDFSFTWHDDPGSGSLSGPPAAVMTTGADGLDVSLAQTEATITLRGAS
jgi:hypothetical protein